MGIAALSDGKVVFEGGGRMSERPIQPLVKALRGLGVRCEAIEFAARYAVQGGTFQGGQVDLRSDISSQFLSSLMMVAPYAKTDIRLQPVMAGVSTPYVSMTMQIMKHFGCEVIQEADASYMLSAGQRYRPAEITVEPDFSGAAVFCAAAALAGGQVTFDYGSARSLQGDYEFLSLLGQFAGLLKRGEGGLTFSSGGEGSYGGMDLDLRAMPDVVPAMTSVLLFARSPGRIRGVGHLRFKESDRLEVLSSELQKIGAKIRLTGDGLEIEPGPLAGGTLDPHDDHRLAMSFAIIGLRVPGISVAQAECVSKSFRSFWRELGKLTGDTADANNSDF
jgi:3-phosphoshikimate 1-carboxyvinyltransferase